MYSSVKAEGYGIIMLCFLLNIAVMKEQEPLQQKPSGSTPEKSNETEPITSDSIKNAHAAGDGAMERSLDSVPDEEELKKGNTNLPRRPQQY